MTTKAVNPLPVPTIGQNRMSTKNFSRSGTSRLGFRVEQALLEGVVANALPEVMDQEVQVKIVQMKNFLRRAVKVEQVILELVFTNVLQENMKLTVEAHLEVLVKAGQL